MELTAYLKSTNDIFENYTADKVNIKNFICKLLNSPCGRYCGSKKVLQRAGLNVCHS